MAPQTMLVGKLIGNAWIRGADGSLTAIQEGMHIPADAKIITGTGSSVELYINGQPPFILGANQEVIAAENPALPPPPEEAATAPIFNSRIGQLIAVNPDVNALDIQDPDAENGATSSASWMSFVRIASLSTPDHVGGDPEDFIAARKAHIPLPHSIANVAGATHWQLETAALPPDNAAVPNTSRLTLTVTPNAVEAGIVTYTASVTAPVTGTALVISLANGQSITIPVNATSGSVDFIAPSTTTLTNSITGVTGGNYEHLETAGTPTTAVTHSLSSQGVGHAALAALHAEQEGGDFSSTSSLMASAAAPGHLSPGDSIMDTSDGIFAHSEVHFTQAMVSGADIPGSTDGCLAANINPMPAHNGFSQATQWDSTALPAGIASPSIVIPGQNSTPHFGEDNLSPYKNRVLSFNEILQTEDENDFYSFLPSSVSSGDTKLITPQEPVFFVGVEQQAILEEINILNTALLFHLVG